MITFDYVSVPLFIVKHMWKESPVSVPFLRTANTHSSAQLSVSSCERDSETDVHDGITTASSRKSDISRICVRFERLLTRLVWHVKKVKPVPWRTLL